MSNSLLPYQFDLSQMTLGDLMTIWRFAGDEKSLTNLALCEMLDRLTVGGIKQQPADALAVIAMDFATKCATTFGSVE